MRTPIPRDKTKRIVAFLILVAIVLLYLSVIWIKNEIVFAAFTDFKRSLADVSIIDGAHLEKQKLELGIDPYEIVQMRLPQGQANSLLSKNILKSCVNKRQECTEPIWQCNSDYNSFGSHNQKITSNTIHDCTVFCTATWWKVINGYRNYIDEVCIDIRFDSLTYQYIET